MSINVNENVPSHTFTFLRVSSYRNYLLPAQYNLSLTD